MRNKPHELCTITGYSSWNNNLRTFLILFCRNGFSSGDGSRDINSHCLIIKFSQNGRTSEKTPSKIIKTKESVNTLGKSLRLPGNWRFPHCCSQLCYPLDFLVSTKTVLLFSYCYGLSVVIGHISLILGCF